MSQDEQIREESPAAGAAATREASRKLDVAMPLLHERNELYKRADELDEQAVRLLGHADKLLAEKTLAALLPDGWLRAGEVLQASPLPKARFKTGIPALDEASRGGLPTGAVVVFQGEPDAGKTGLALQIALKIAMDQDVVVVIYAPDGGRENAEIRLGALLGFNATKLEERDAGEIDALREKLADRRIYFPDHSREDTTFASIVSDGQKIEPELPHLYLVDSIQECRATEDSDELDERRRVVEIMREMQKVTTATVPTLCLACSQTNTASFANRKPKDRTRPIAAGAESGKIAFLSSLIVHLDGDPSPKGAPDFGRAQIVKSKLGGSKPTFGLKLDQRTTELQEIDAAIVEQDRTEQKEREETDRMGALGDRALNLLMAHGPLSVSQLHGRIGGRRQDLLNALNGLEAQGAAGWKAGPRGARLWEAVRRG